MNEQQAVVSNKFTVSLLEDGGQLSGVLVSNKSLTQGWNGRRAVPTWTDPDNQPTVYLMLTYGGELVTVVGNDGQWTYNGIELSFDTTPIVGVTPAAYACTTPGYENIFRKTTVDLGTQARPVVVPALKIVGDLAGTDLDENGTLNTDADEIGFKGTFQLEGARTFEIFDVIVVTITSLSSSSYFGILEATKLALTSQQDTTTINAKLYSPEGASIADNAFWTRYTVNGTYYPDAGSSAFSQVHEISLPGSAFIDYATVECEFRLEQDGETMWTAVIGIDDLQDNDVMMITSAVDTLTKIQNNEAIYGPGSDATMTRDKYIKFRMWMATKQDIQKPVNSFPYFFAKILDYKGTLVTDNLASGQTPNVVNVQPNYPSGLRPMNEETWNQVNDSYAPANRGEGNTKNIIVFGGDIKTQLSGSMTGVIYGYKLDIIANQS